MKNRVNFAIVEGVDRQQFNREMCAALQAMRAREEELIAIVPDQMPHRQTTYVATVFYLEAK